MKRFLFVVVFLATFSAQANERIRSRGELIAEGYKVWSTDFKPTGGTEPEIPGAHTLPWPVSFQDKFHSVANAMAEFQPFGDPYFHGGCDLRVRSAAEVTAPISGALEAGHYSYEKNPDGSLKKYWKPWPQTGEALYFEVAVVSDSGVRFEFHHVDRKTLPREIVNLLNRGGGRVEKGALLGHTVYWPDGDYHHIHYNVILPDGTIVNPEYVSPLLPDHSAPEIQGAYAVLPNGETVRFGKGNFSAIPKEFAIALVDKQENNVYEHPAVYASLDFASGAQSTWDFRRTLQTVDGNFPGLWDFFVESLSTPDGYIETTGGYGTGVSVLRLKVPEGARGKFTITLGDIAGNATTLEGSL